MRCSRFLSSGQAGSVRAVACTCKGLWQRETQEALVWVMHVAPREEGFVGSGGGRKGNAVGPGLRRRRAPVGLTRDAGPQSVSVCAPAG